MSSFICSTTKVTRETARLGRTEKQREVHVARSLPAGSVSQPMRRVGRHFQGRHFEKRSRAGAPGQRGARGSAERSGGGQGASRLCKKGRAAPADAAGAARGPWAPRRWERSTARTDRASPPCREPAGHGDLLTPPFPARLHAALVKWKITASQCASNSLSSSQGARGKSFHPGIFLFSPSSSGHSSAFWKPLLYVAESRNLSLVSPFWILLSPSRYLGTSSFGVFLGESIIFPVLPWGTHYFPVFQSYILL